MKAIQVLKPGGPEALTLADLPVPQPKPNEALIKVAASGVNFIDVYFREGRYPAPLPFVDGQEGSGVVTQAGSEVKSLKPGDRVAWTGVLGSYAEYAVVPVDRLIKVPDGVDDRHAAAAMLQEAGPPAEVDKNGGCSMSWRGSVSVDAQRRVG